MIGQVLPFPVKRPIRRTVTIHIRFDNMAEDRQPSLLVIVVDTNPVWWGQQVLKQHGELVLSRCMEAVLVLANTHLMMNHRNKLAIIAAHTDSSQFLYPKPGSDTNTAVTNGEEEDVAQRGEADGKYELFAQVDNTVKDGLKDLVNADIEGGLVSSDSLVAGAMAMALCYINRLTKEAEIGDTFSSRVLVVKGAEDNPSQYMNFMNVVFTAQKQNVAIDACILENESGLLQQACDISGGTYLKIPQLLGLLQYLLWVFLPDVPMRKKLTLPPMMAVDYRAACFCHRHLIDVGYVCSVCLSVFCTFSPICSTCQTTFKLQPLPKATKKKNKRSTTNS